MARYFPRRVGNLPIPDQRRIVEGGEITLFRAESPADPVHIKAVRLHPKQIDQVFARGHIRDVGEQSAWVSARRRGDVPRMEPANIQVDAKRHEVVIGGVRLKRRDLVNLLARID
jgi:hypothetical protein